MVTVCCLVCVALFLLLSPPAAAFTDVPDTHRYARAIERLADLGIVSGKGDGTFRPDDPVYRAQFAKMMCGLLGIHVDEDQSYAPFVDLDSDDPNDLYPHEFVGAAYKAGITRGKTATTFSPYTDITLPQAITMIIRAADSYYPGLVEMVPPNWLGCWPNTDPDHGDNIRSADYADLLTSVPIPDSWAHVLRPATRGEVSQILVNLLSTLDEHSVSLSFEGRTLSLARPVYLERNRYFVPMTDLVTQIGGTISLTQGLADINTAGFTVKLDIERASYKVGGQRIYMKQQPFVADDSLYICLFDLQKMLDLKVVWDEAASSIHLYRNRDRLEETAQAQEGRPALIRFEDIVSQQRYASAEALEKLRIVFDYCYAKGIPMHLGWVPRYIDPLQGVDDAPAQDDSMHNANFVYTLDYFLDRHGLIGLHGYTHQSGSQISISGVEFDAEHNTSESSVRQRIQRALEDAARLDIPIAFWESPHYAALFSQQSIMGQYFDILYEPKILATERYVTTVPSGTRAFMFVPTPLGYVNGPWDTENMMERIRSYGDSGLGSFFFHPNLEVSYIKTGLADDGYPIYEYAESSPLHRIVDTFAEQGYTFISIREL